jgi:DNA-directed RNA polymerase subunit M/transcription elongation factor TFIIS
MTFPGGPMHPPVLNAPIEWREETTQKKPCSHTLTPQAEEDAYDLMDDFEQVDFWTWDAKSKIKCPDCGQPLTVYWTGIKRRGDEIDWEISDVEASTEQNPSELKLQVLDVQYHRNGVTGRGFYVILADEPTAKYPEERCQKIIIRPDSPRDEEIGVECFVVNPELAFTAHSIDSAWRGDYYVEIADEIIAFYKKVPSEHVFQWKKYYYGKIFPTHNPPQDDEGEVNLKENPVSMADWKEAIAGEGWAINDYTMMMEQATPEEKELLAHIAGEEKEHLDEIIEHLQKNADDIIKRFEKEGSGYREKNPPDVAYGEWIEDGEDIKIATQPNPPECRHGNFQNDLFITGTPFHISWRNATSSPYQQVIIHTPTASVNVLDLDEKLEVHIDTPIGEHQQMQVEKTRPNPPPLCPHCKNIILAPIKTNPPGTLQCPNCKKAFRRI